MGDVKQPICGLDAAFQRVGGKYKARVLWYIFLDKNVLRYGELKKKLENITSKMLTQVLRELEADNLLHRKIYRQVPPKVEYSLTEKAKELIPILSLLGKWGDSQMKK